MCSRCAFKLLFERPCCHEALLMNLVVDLIGNEGDMITPQVSSFGQLAFEGERCVSFLFPKPTVVGDALKPFKITVVNVDWIKILLWPYKIEWEGLEVFRRSVAQLERYKAVDAWL